MDKENMGKKIKFHKRIYIFLLVLGLISLTDIISRNFIGNILQNNESDIGILGLLIISITRNPIVIGLSVVLLDFGVFLLIIALLERQTYKKLKKSC